ncbi:kinase-like domain-containing protein [Aspergillus carlsbadensis]|nr:kinase-like domain-containing protein [Aspergillus carlsbadensis]
MGICRLFLHFSNPSKGARRFLIFSKSMATCPNRTQIGQPPFIPSVEAEPLHRYKHGGYHPTLLGDVFHSGRYKILHKLGWGGYSTVWAARDTRYPTRELRTMQELASHHQARPKHTVQMLDEFSLEGPNGSHQCLIYELLGPSVSDICEAKFPGGRLPGKLAKSIARQSLVAIYARNLAFAMPRMNDLSEEEFLRTLGKSEVGSVHRRDNDRGNLGSRGGVPRYIVRPAALQTHMWDPAQPIKLIDFGGSFSRDTVPHTLHTPLTLRAPEVIFQDRLDYRVVLWSMGCLLFELFTGQPPFDSSMITPAILIGQMREMASDDLPERWREMADTRYKNEDADTKTANSTPGPNLQEWLQEVYFEGSSRTPDLDRADIQRLGGIIARLLCFEPDARASAREVLEDPWFDE